MNLLHDEQAKHYIESEGYLIKPEAGFYFDGSWIAFNFFEGDYIEEKESVVECIKYLSNPVGSNLKSNL